MNDAWRAARPDPMHGEVVVPPSDLLFIQSGINGGSFICEIDGVPIGMFTEVSGLEVTMQPAEIPEGGVNDHVHKLPGRSTWPNIVLRRGVTQSDALFQWMKRTGQGVDPTKPTSTDYVVRPAVGAISLTSVTGMRLRTWVFQDAIPVRWAGPRFASTSTEMPQEELEIAHSGFEASNLGVDV